MSGRCAVEEGGAEVREGGRLVVTVELLAEDAIVVSARLGPKAFRGALLSSQFDWIKPIVSENVFNWDYSLKHNFAHTNISVNNFSTTNSIIIPSKLLSSPPYICDNCKKKMFNNYKAEHKLSRCDLSNNISKSDILLLKQTLSYPELQDQKLNVATSIDSRSCKRPSLDNAPRKLKRKKIFNIVENDKQNQEEEKETSLKLRSSKVEKFENKPFKENIKHKLSKQNNEIKSKSFIKSESITSNHSTICHENYRVMPQSLERLNNISIVESNQEIEEFFNRECPKPKKKWMKMNEKEDNQNSYDSLNKNEYIDSDIKFPLLESFAMETPLEPIVENFLFQSVENPVEVIPIEPTQESFDNSLFDTIVKEYNLNTNIEPYLKSSLDSVEDLAMQPAQDNLGELSECNIKDLIFESVSKDLNTEINGLFESEMQNSPLQSIIEDYPLESVIKNSLESISKYFTFESISKDFPIEFITTDLNRKSVINDHSSSFNPIIESTYNEEFIDSLNDNFDDEFKSSEVTSKAIIHSKFSHFNRSYKIKQSLHDKVILTVERGSLNDIKSIPQIPDIYSFTDEDDASVSASLLNNYALSIPQQPLSLRPEINSSSISANENNATESAKCFKSSHSPKRPKRRCTNKMEKSILDRKVILDTKGKDLDHVPLLNSCENSAGTTFKVDDVVWAKITGYPYWPGKIISFSEDDSTFISCIEWYAWKEVSFIKVNNLFHFKEFYKSKYQRKKRSSKYQEAVKLAKSCCGMLDGVDSIISDDCRTLCSTRGSDSDSGSHEGSGTSVS